MNPFQFIVTFLFVGVHVCALRRARHYKSAVGIGFVSPFIVVCDDCIQSYIQCCVARLAEFNQCWYFWAAFGCRERCMDRERERCNHPDSYSSTGCRTVDHYARGSYIKVVELHAPSLTIPIFSLYWSIRCKPSRAFGRLNEKWGSKI